MDKKERDKMTLNYTKKLLKHFNNPKHVKDIKNPDGVGEVGNIRCGDILNLKIKVEKNKIKDIGFRTFGCLPPQEKINKENVWINISEVSGDDIILNGKGEKTKIKETYKGLFKGELFYIIPFVSRFNGFLVTPTHPLLCVKRKFIECSRKSSNKCDWLRVSEKDLMNSKLCYVEAAYTEPGDYLVFPKIKDIKDNSKFTKDLMKLIGYYLSEGYITAKGYVLTFSFNKNEVEYINEVEYLIKKIINKEAKVRTRNNVSEIYVCSAKWCRFFEKYCGKYAKKKKISEEIMLLPSTKQWEMLKTYINGDGNTYRRRPKDSITYRMDTTSESLAIQLQRILARRDIFASIKRFKTPPTLIEGRKIPSSVVFNISFKKDKKHKFVKENSKYFFVPVKRVERKKFMGKVYNLKVSGKNPSYLVRGFVVHNCAAAIASSDVVCELAKGKTLEEAEKITKDDIVKKLGGMPPVKIHCSVLGIEALKKAIENYRSSPKRGQAKAIQDYKKKGVKRK